MFRYRVRYKAKFWVVDIVDYQNKRLFIRNEKDSLSEWVSMDDNIIVEAYLGNGIYVGDILRHEYDDYTYEVKYDDQDKQFVVIEEDTASIDFSIVDIKHFYVIGNIHEQPTDLEGLDNE